MKIFIIVTLLCVCISLQSMAQQTVIIQVKDAVTFEKLIGATITITSTNSKYKTNDNGVAIIPNLPVGKQVFSFSFVDYETQLDTIMVLANRTDTVVKYLKGEVKSLDEVVVSSTRLGKTLYNSPTRVETVVGGELEEKTVTQPANVKMILTESTGIQTQQTSATSGSVSIRIQGMNGKYTQMLRDGFPLYAGFSSGLSVLQIPPLDLKRVELIKGSSSTLYGGGAIAGLINFVSKTPQLNKELSFLVNGNSTKAADVSAYYAQRFKKIGITCFASQNKQAAYDANNDGLSDIPRFKQYNINPKLFYYVNTNTELMLGLNMNWDNRIGGDMYVIQHQADTNHQYFERNKSKRFSAQFKVEHKFNPHSLLIFKNSFGLFNRSITMPNYSFKGKQQSSFSELSYLKTNKTTEWVIGANVWTDDFKQKLPVPHLLNNNLNTYGAFVQNSWKPFTSWHVETGLRVDVNSLQQTFVLPRIAILYKINSKWTSRLSSGFGYKPPTLFTEDAETVSYSHVQPINYGIVNSEKSVGGNIDFTYKTKCWDEVDVTINQMFFYNQLNNPIVLQNVGLTNPVYAYANVDGYMISKGFETSLKIKIDELNFYGGYTYVDAYTTSLGIKQYSTLTAKHRFYGTLTYEIEDKLRLAYEAFYTGSQTLEDGTTTPDYWIMGCSVQYNWKNLSFFINAENFTDVRQSKFGQVYTGSLLNPSFKPIYTSLEGFVGNAGVRIQVWK